MSNSPSPFLLIFRDAPTSAYEAMSPEQRQHLLQRWNDWYDALDRQGIVQHGHPLEPEGRVVSGARGERITDGPFAEAKESIGGYFFVQVPDLEAATAVARQCPGLRHGMSVEVRPVAAACARLRPQSESLAATVSHATGPVSSDW